MLRIFAVIYSLGKRLDAHLTSGVERRGRYLAGLNRPRPARRVVARRRQPPKSSALTLVMR
ncbi:conserved hypothetical protein [Hyphomicrobiales bacterium]|nr:conserved hypothetical protein [Hyphomicrobiales bacterium]CAH1701195.1 conserved hypothetical protein [Hyphomicrobiales bacterium]CAI0345159.1 conserved hypothetical protein [Hyphomicrobiales bacterium]